MKRRRVFQYKCDFCGKKMYIKGKMKIHEKRCKKNPEHECKIKPKKHSKKTEATMPKPVDTNKLMVRTASIEWKHKILMVPAQDVKVGDYFITLDNWASKIIAVDTQRVIKGKKLVIIELQPTLNSSCRREIDLGYYEKIRLGYLK